MENKKDYTNGKSFFKWITDSVVDKLIAYVFTPGIIVIGYLLAFVWEIEYPEDLLFSYIIDVFAGLITAIVMQKSMWGSKVFKYIIIPCLIVLILTLSTIFGGWRVSLGFYSIFILSVYWGGFYLMYKQEKNGISS